MKKFLFIGKYIQIIFGTIISSTIISCCAPHSIAADEIALTSGALLRSIKINNIENFTKTGVADGLLKNIIDFSGLENEQVIRLLNQKINLPLYLTHRLLNTKIGDVLVKRVSKIIYPIRAPEFSTSGPAIRAAIIDGLASNDENISMLIFLKSYPNDIMTLNIPALLEVVEQSESIAALVDYFSNSPLDSLKGGRP